MNIKRISVACSALLTVFGAVAGATSEAIVAKPSPHAIYVDGAKVDVAAYEIADNNYFKLRDIAAVVNGTAKQFEVKWDGQTQAIALASGQPYTTVGGELGALPAGNKDAKPSTAAVYLDGTAAAYTGYEINDNNYYKLRDVAQNLDIGIKWDGANQRVDILTDVGYGGEDNTPADQPEKNLNKIVKPTGETKTLSYKLVVENPRGDYVYPGFKVEIYKAYRRSFTEEPAAVREYKVAEGLSGSDGTVTLTWEVPAAEYEKHLGREQYLAVLPAQTVDGIAYSEDGRFMSIGVDMEWPDRAWPLTAWPQK